MVYHESREAYFITLRMYSCAFSPCRAFSKFIESLSDIKQEKYDAEDKKRGVDHKVIGYVTLNYSSGL